MRRLTALLLTASLPLADTPHYANSEATHAAQ